MKTPLWKSDVVERVTGGVSTGHWVATGFSIDSRTVVQGDVFLCLKGPLFDGHDHVREARERGAVAAIVHHDVDGDIPVVRVGDTYEALKALAVESRRRTKAKLIGVTGSFGKTSTKEALKLVLGHQGKVIASQRSYNNFWGVPLTLCQLPEDYDYGVIEIGMNYPNEITPLSQLVRPDVCLVTTVERMHIENCGSYEGVADAKSEIFDGMSRGAPAVLKKDNLMFERMESRAKLKGLEVITFGADPTADARLIDTKIVENRLHVKAVIGSRDLEYCVPAVGEHWAYNSLGLLSVVWLLGANVELAAASLSQFQLLDGRGAIKEIPFCDGKVIILDESYNAGPGSMIAALRTLGRLTPGERGRRIAVLGDMGELGDQSRDLHVSLKEHIMENNIDVVFATGEKMHDLYQVLEVNHQGYHNNDLEIFASEVANNIRSGDVVMVKGSRGMRAYVGRMSKVIEKIVEKSRQLQVA